MKPIHAFISSANVNFISSVSRSVDSQSLTKPIERLSGQHHLLLPTVKPSYDLRGPQAHNYLGTDFHDHAIRTKNTSREKKANQLNVSVHDQPHAFSARQLEQCTELLIPSGIDRHQLTRIMSSIAASPSNPDDQLIFLTKRGSDAPSPIGAILFSEQESVLFALAIHPDHHRSGLGGFLLASALDHTHRSATANSTVYLSTDEAHKAAIALYEKAGAVDLLESKRGINQEIKPVSQQYGAERQQRSLFSGINFNVGFDLNFGFDLDLDFSLTEDDIADINEDPTSDRSDRLSLPNTLELTIDTDSKQCQQFIKQHLYA